MAFYLCASTAIFYPVPQRVTALTEENSRLQVELSRCREELDTQRSRTQEMESRHDAQLGDIRQAGHDALAVVVEQYKVCLL